jgi:hypothetical protein
VSTSAPVVSDKGFWHVRTTVAKYHEDRAQLELSAEEFYSRFTPYEVREVEGNVLLNEGIAEMLDLLIAAAGTTAYNNANARIGVGDSTTAAAATDTGLIAATNVLFKGMLTGFPTRTGQTVTFKSEFTGTEANFVWNEWSVDNGSTRNRNLNRKVQSLGTKTSGTWTLQVDITIT